MSVPRGVAPPRVTGRDSAPLASSRTTSGRTRSPIARRRSIPSADPDHDDVVGRVRIEAGGWLRRGACADRRHRTDDLAAAVPAPRTRAPLERHGLERQRADDRLSLRDHRGDHRDPSRVAQIGHGAGRPGAAAAVRTAAGGAVPSDDRSGVLMRTFRRTTCVPGPRRGTDR